ncbi:MAG: hypothetical protein ACE5IY_19775 [bacterium]
MKVAPRRKTRGGVFAFMNTNSPFRAQQILIPAATRFLLSLMLAGLSAASAWFAGLQDSLLVIVIATSALHRQFYRDIRSTRIKKHRLANSALIFLRIVQARSPGLRILVEIGEKQL